MQLSNLKNICCANGYTGKKLTNQTPAPGGGVIHKYRNMNYYIRFTSDIEADIERGHSVDFRDKSELGGLCAWRISEDFDPYDDDSVIHAAEATAKKVAQNTYGGYGSETLYAVVEGSYLGSGNDGVLIRVERVLAELSL